MAQAEQTIASADIGGACVKWNLWSSILKLRSGEVSLTLEHRICHTILKAQPLKRCHKYLNFPHVAWKKGNIQG